VEKQLGCEHPTSTSWVGFVGSGNLFGISWLHYHDIGGCVGSHMDWAAQYGHFDVVKWLHYNRSEGCTSDAMNWAAEKGHLEVVQFLYENRIYRRRYKMCC
jgi:hypothetical protein